MNNFLRNRGEVDAATQYLIDNGLVQSGLSCKNWEIGSLIPYLTDGNLIDLGSDGSVVLENIVKLGFKGRKVGIDLAYDMDSYVGGVELYKADLMNLKVKMINHEQVSLNFESYFDTVTCLSVVEHSVDFEKLAKECGMLLKDGGKLFISFDYWPEKINTKGILLYNLEWNILSKEDVLTLIHEFKNNGLELTSEVDWAVQDTVINSLYCSPSNLAAYTFGILEFIKK